jgi:hypothetical protein
MAEESLGRRNVLRNAGVAAGGVVLGGATLASPAYAGGRHRGSVEGSWRVLVSNDDGSRTDSVVSFAAGGVCIVHDISPAGPPFTGTWRAGHHGSFRATVLTGTPGEGGPGTPGVVIVLRLEGAAQHESLSGSFTFRVTAPDGSEVATGSGTFEGPRVEA